MSVTPQAKHAGIIWVPHFHRPMVDFAARSEDCGGVHILPQWQEPNYRQKPYNIAEAIQTTNS